MSLRSSIRALLLKYPDVYLFYTRLRYGSNTAVRDWVLSSQKFIQKHELNNFIFEEGQTFVRIKSGHEFKYVPAQMGGLLGLEFKKGFESEDIQSVFKLLPDDPVVLDVGANFGIYSVLIAAKSRASQVHSFEPIKETAYLLRTNAERNSVTDRITINNVAVGSEPGSVLITTDRYAGNYLLQKSSYDGSSHEVPVIRLDDYVFEMGLQRVDFIKCDVEGAELLVMKGARRILSRMHPIVMLEIADEWTSRFGYSAAELKSYMDDAGYDCKHGSEVAADLGLDSAGASKTHNYFFFPRIQ